MCSFYLKILGQKWFNLEQKNMLKSIDVYKNNFLKKTFFKCAVKLLIGTTLFVIMMRQEQFFFYIYFFLVKHGHNTFNYGNKWRFKKKIGLNSLVQVFPTATTQPLDLMYGVLIRLNTHCYTFDLTIVEFHD